jgi:hypothetical protein
VIDQGKVGANSEMDQQYHSLESDLTVRGVFRKLLRAQSIAAPIDREIFADNESEPSDFVKKSQMMPSSSLSIRLNYSFRPPSSTYSAYSRHLTTVVQTPKPTGAPPLNHAIAHMLNFANPSPCCNVRPESQTPGTITVVHLETDHARLRHPANRIEGGLQAALHKRIKILL